MPTAVRSHAKINLGLYIGAPRPDGFHALTTVYQTLELHDVVTVTARPAATTQLRLTCNNRFVPTDSRNTAWKMVALALETLQISTEVEIHIEKLLPVQGGLGAGSANAVAALVGLEVELGIGYGAAGLPPFEQKPLEGWGAQYFSQSAKEAGAPSFSRSGRKGWEATRLALAAQVGSDVPLFLIGGTILGLDRGQQVFPLPDVEPVWCVVATPEVGVSTPRAFRDWDALCASESLTAEASTDKLNELSRAYASAFAGAIPGDRSEAGSFGALSVGKGLAGPQESALVRTGITSWIENDFERVVFPQQSSLAEIKRHLAASGTPEAALLALLSGSGSALFGLYQTLGDAEAARERLRSVGVRSHLTRTLPRSAYWSEMLLPQQN
jgi:4-diphosphocytidyl-2-C-methyl-D-erythritol kinase